MNQLSADRYRVIWLAIVILMLVAHWFFFVGYLVSDDWLYLSQAKRYLAGDFSLPKTHWGFRYTVVLPLTLAGLIVDYSEWVLALFPLLYWIGIFWLTLWFMQRTFGREQALYVGILVATLPLFVVQSSIAGVDITEAFFLFAAFASFYLADTSSEPSYRGYLVAGLLVGLALLTRETAYGFLIVLGLFFLLGGYRRWQYYLIGLAGVLGVLSLEWAYYLTFDQGPLYRLQTISQSHGAIGLRTGDFAAGSGNITDNRWLGPVLAVLLNQEFALLYWVAIGASVYLYRQHDPSHRRLLRYTMITFLAYFAWIGYSGAVRPLPRYFSFHSVLAMLPIALMLAHLSRPWVRNLTLMVLVGASFAALSVENVYPRFSSRAVSEFAMQSGDAIVTDERSAWQARQYLKLAGHEGALITDQVIAGTPFTFAAVDGLAPPADVKPLLTPEAMIGMRKPPKLLVGHLLDWSGLSRLLPVPLYNYLAIRNPTVRFYRLSGLAG